MPHRYLKLGQDRQSLERELTELTAKLATLADQMHRAAEAHDMRTVTDLSIEAYDVDLQIEDKSFVLGLIYESVK